MTAWIRLWLPGFVGVAMLAGGGCPCAFAESANNPRLFAPGIISGPADDLSPAFSPDGNAVYFTRANASASTIMMSNRVHGRWSLPKLAAFSGQWSDLEPAMAPDGEYQGKTLPGGGGNLWRVDRSGNGWDSPKRLPEFINEGSAVFSPSIAADGSLYFMRADTQSGSFHLLRSQYRSGSYLAPEAVAVGDDTTEEVDPAVAPDESYLVYSSSHPGKRDPKRLTIVFRRADAWSTPQDLGDEVNEAGSNIEARLGPDHRTLYFSTNTVPPVSFPRSERQTQRDLAQMLVWANGRENIWYVSLAPWLDRRGEVSVAR